MNFIIAVNMENFPVWNGDKIGNEAFNPRISLIEENDFPITLKRHQFPVRLAFASTINKIQGQTFEKIGIDFTEESFAHGQTYVALSRVRSWESKKIKVDKSNNEKKIKNIVWREVLL
jgi:ATP-dependent exoDNAse (exonuclease V) alpha subunit